MGDNAMKDGWQRFLDRLKQFWGEPSGSRRATLPVTLGTPVPIAIGPSRRAEQPMSYTEQMRAWENEGGALRHASKKRQLNPQI